MTDQAKTSAVPAGQLPDLVRDLLQQRFAEARHLAQATWEQVCAQMEGTLAADPQADELRESFEQAKGVYCQILMEIEALAFVPPPEKPLAEWFAAPKAAPTPAPAKKAFELHGATKDYWAVAQFLVEHAKGELAFPHEYAERMQGIALTFALESECQRLFTPALATFWSERQAAIQTVVDDTDAFRLKKALHAPLEELAKQHTDWLGDSKFPHTVVSMALRYFYARVGHQDFVPALSEAAMLALFFGPAGKIGEWEPVNSLGLNGLQPTETIELAFRFFHAQRLRKKLLSVSHAVDKGLLQIVITNSKRCLQLTKKLSSAANEAAA